VMHASDAYTVKEWTGSRHRLQNSEVPHEERCIFISEKGVTVLCI
jgi:hypothetical protein